mmetsp:Transcript_86991/g.136239  ORF Transcript_86991/g.136239 Transcript_86991/m.136239 type:complete len:142 (+) Transcript_86991:30-455(+)
MLGFLSCSRSPEGGASNSRRVNVSSTAPGDGKTFPQRGELVSVHYDGFFSDQKKFSTSKGGKPMQFAVGGGHVIPGWEEAVCNMTLGETAHVFIPYEKGFGAKGFEDVPPNTDLFYELQLVSVGNRVAPQFKEHMCGCPIC